RLQPLHQFQRIPHRRMRGMWMMPERIEKQDIEVLQLGKRLFRHTAEISEICHSTEAITLDGSIAMMHNQRSERRPKQFQRPIHRPYLDLREPTVLVVRLEDVPEDVAQHLLGHSAGKQWNLSAAGDSWKAERPDIVQPKNMVGVAVGVKHGINFLDALANGLLAEIRCSVDKYRTSVPLHHHRGTRAAVVRVCRGTHPAVAADSRHPHRRPTAQHSERRFHPALAPAPGPPWGGRVIKLVT